MASKTNEDNVIAAKLSPLPREVNRVEVAVISQNPTYLGL